MKKIVMSLLALSMFSNGFGQKRNSTDITYTKEASVECDGVENAYQIVVYHLENTITKQSGYSISVQDLDVKTLRFFTTEEFLKLQTWSPNSPYVQIPNYGKMFLTNFNQYPNAKAINGQNLHAEQTFWAAEKTADFWLTKNNSTIIDYNAYISSHPFKTIDQAVGLYNDYYKLKGSNQLTCMQEKEIVFEKAGDVNDGTAELLNDWFTDLSNEKNVSLKPKIEAFKKTYIQNFNSLKTNPNPVITIKKANGICNNNLSIPSGITDKSGNFHKFNTIKWSTGEKTNSITVNENKVYSVSVSSDLGVGYATISVVNNPSVIIGSPLEILIGSTVLSINDYSKNVKKVTWSTKETTPTVVPKTNGQYYVNIETTCGNFKSNTILINSPKPPFPNGGNSAKGYRKKDINASDATLNLKIYPNVVTDKLNIDIPVEHTLESVKVYDLMYNVVGTSEYSNNNNTESIDLSHLKAGNYIIEIQGSNGIERQRIVKE